MQYMILLKNADGDYELVAVCDTLTEAITVREACDDSFIVIELKDNGDINL